MRLASRYVALQLSTGQTAPISYPLRNSLKKLIFTIRSAVREPDCVLIMATARKDMPPYWLWLVVR